MDLLFRREQTSGRFARVTFRLWSKIELTEEETELADRYRFHDAILIVTEQEQLLRQTVNVGITAGLVVGVLFYLWLGLLAAGVMALFAGAGTGYLYFTEKRETIYVKDLLHGRHFSCRSIVDIAEKELHLKSIVTTFRQVMEAAKNWDGTEQIPIEPTGDR